MNTNAWWGVAALLVGCTDSPSSADNVGAGAQAGTSVGGELSGAGSAGASALAGSGAAAGETSGGAAGTGGVGGLAGEANGGGAGGSNAIAPVDPTTLSGKHLFGYQGWFACPGDGAPRNRWVHWFRSNTPSAVNATFDLWPDVSELDDDELFATSMTLPGGGAARLFSAFKEKTVVRHFAWMEAAGVDGVLVQRFLADVRNTTTRQIRDQVLKNARAGAEAHGRVFAVMYDISGAPGASLTTDLQAEWHYLVETLKITDSPRYLRHAGKPVLAVWGLGFTDRPGTAQQAQAIVTDLQTGKYPVALIGGVPTGWRTLDDDSKTEAAWADVYRSFDVVSPWAVGRYTSDSGADTFRTEHIAPDLAELEPLGKSYMPVVFPGFSWHNLNGAALNQIPRRGGAFYWRQVYNAVEAGSTMLYGAMFDEVDEGTAFFKVAAKQADLPAQSSFLALDADGQDLPSDWYLQLAGAATSALRAGAAPGPELPISPP